MKRYRVKTGVAKLAVGCVLVLESAQIRSRREQLRIPKNWDGIKPCRVTALAPVEFKSGEVVGLSDPPKGIVGLLEEVPVKAA